MAVWLPSSLRTIAATLAVFSLLLAGWWFLIRTDSPGPAPEIQPDDFPPDPRLTFDSPFRNIQPSVAYVGDTACAACHTDIDKSYHQHPMGRSAALTRHAADIEHFAAGANQFTALGRLECRIEKQAERVLHHVIGKDKDGQQQVAYSLDASLAIGSGTRGRSYLYVQDGRVWQSPVSWYSRKSIWDLSPGFHNEERFQRPIESECLFCHTHQVKPVPKTENRYREPIFQTQAAIGCERCHGPGEMHVAERSSGAIVRGIDTSIVNPKHLPAALRDSVCQQCHLQGEARIAQRGRNIYEYRPGLPMNLFVTAYIKHPNLIDYAKSVGQFEQLSISKCFASSPGKLSCISCHDPHEAPAKEQKVDWYRGKCLTCHQDKGCKLPVSERKVEADSCIACHMTGNPSANIAHTSVTDHRILRFPPKETIHRVIPLRSGESPLVVFGKATDAAAEPEDDRSRGLALAKWALDFPPAQRHDQQTVLAMARTQLEASLRKWPGDVPALEALAQVLALQGRSEQALKSIKTALVLASDRERTLSIAVKIALQAGETTLAADCATRIVEMNPTSFRHLMKRALVRIELQKLAEAEADLRAALSENPTHGQLRVILAACLQRRGDAAAAQRELKKALSMASDSNEESLLRALFHNLSRSPTGRSGPIEPQGMDRALSHAPAQVCNGERSPERPSPVGCRLARSWSACRQGRRVHSARIRPGPCRPSGQRQLL